jgi:short-subunit dehydrogenase involved in D-alanine esterification of teichoic acids
VTQGLTHVPQREAPVSRNTKTALILASVALAFFLAIIAKYGLLR